MAAAIATVEPTTHQIGNTLVFTRTLPDYPASTWTLTYELRGRELSQSVTLTATADGDDFDIEVAPAAQSTWTKGEYTIVGYVTDGTDRYEVYRGSIELTADIASTTFHDGRTFWEKVRDDLKEVIRSGVIRETLRYSYNGVSTEIVTMDDAFRALAYAEQRIAQERPGSQQRVLTRFVRPR